MKIGDAKRIREEYMERALDEKNLDTKILDIWNTSVYICACYNLFVSNPIRNVKYAFKIRKKMRKLETLMEGENF